MSVVAGCSLLDGLILGADSRVSFAAEGTYSDTLQKLVFLTDHTVLGFAGDVSTAVHLLKSMRRAQGERRNAVILRQWLPRLFAYEFARFPDARAVTFMVGSVIPSRPNVIRKAAAAQAVLNAVRSRPSGSINGISPIFARVMNFPAERVYLLNRPQGLLYTMRSPDFSARRYEPLSAVAIGSGSGLQEKMLEVSDQLFFGTVPNDDVNWLGRSMNHFLRANNVGSVGGSFTIAKITSAGIVPMSRTTVLINERVAYELIYERDRWVQRNRTTGEEIRLCLPWELDQTIRADHRFDDLRPAM
jgi:hypothetical protein